MLRLEFVIKTSKSVILAMYYLMVIIDFRLVIINKSFDNYYDCLYELDMWR